MSENNNNNAKQTANNSTTDDLTEALWDGRGIVIADGKAVVDDGDED